MVRKAKVKRATKETSIVVSWNVDGGGEYKISTGIPFFDHMLSLFAKHGLFDLEVKAKGDIDVDNHHTVEDVGIAMGAALRDALGGMEGIKRYGSASRSHGRGALHGRDRSIGTLRLCLEGKAPGKDRRVRCGCG